MRKLVYGIRIFLRDLSSSPENLLLPLLVLSLSMFVLYWFLFLRQGMERGIERLSRGLYARIFLERGTEPEKFISLLQKRAKIEKWRLINPDEAFREFSHLYPKLARILGNENPFPPNIEVVFSPGQSPKIIRGTLKEIQALPGVEDVVFQWEAVEKLRKARKRFEEVGEFLTALLVLASALIIANLVAVGVASHSEEIALMELLGASRSFSSLPFVLMGSLLSLMGALLGLLLFLLSRSLLSSFLPPFFGQLSPLYMGGLILGSFLVGLLASLIAIKRP